MAPAATCSFCAGALRPGATFCATCGHAVEGARPVEPLRPTLRPRAPAAPRQANPRAAIGIVAMGGVVLVIASAFALFGPSGITDLGAFLSMLLAQVPIVGLAWAVWRGHQWARWLALVLTIAWVAFMVSIVPPSWAAFRVTSLSETPYFWWSNFANLAIAFAEIVLAAFTAYALVRPKRGERG